MIYMAAAFSIELNKSYPFTKSLLWRNNHQ